MSALDLGKMGKVGGGGAGPRGVPNMECLGRMHRVVGVCGSKRGLCSGAWLEPLIRADLVRFGVITTAGNRLELVGKTQWHRRGTSG